MDHTGTDVPSHREIEAIIRDARKLQAETLLHMMKTAARWVAHPRLGHRHA